MTTFSPHAGLGIYRLDEHGQLTDVNALMLQFFDVDCIESLRHCDQFNLAAPCGVRAVVPWHNATSRSGQLFDEHFQRGQPIAGCLTNLADDDAVPRWILETLTPVRETSGRLEGWVGTLQDVTVIQQRHQIDLDAARARANESEQNLTRLCQEMRLPVRRLRQAIKEGQPQATTTRLCDTIDHLLDLETERGWERVATETFRLCDVVEQLATSVATEIQRSGRRITTLIDHELPSVVRGDLQSLQRVLLPLLQDAAMDTSFGDVHVNVAKRGRRILFSVRMANNGVFADAMLANSLGARASGQAEWHVVTRYAQRLGSKLSTQRLHQNAIEISFEVNFPAAAEIGREEPIVPGFRAGTRVLVLSDHAATRETLVKMIAAWRVEVSACDTIETAVQRIRIAQRLMRRIDVLVVDESIFESGQTFHTEAINCFESVRLISLENQPHARPSPTSPHQRRRGIQTQRRLQKPVRLDVLRQALASACSEVTGETVATRSQKITSENGVMNLSVDRSWPSKSSAAAVASNEQRRSSDSCGGPASSMGENEPIEVDLDGGKPSPADLMQMDQLHAQCGGDTSLSAVVLEVMRSSMPRRVIEMQMAANRGDLDSVGRIAHQMSGAASDCALTAVAETTAELKAHATAKDAKQVHACVSVLQQRVEQTIEAMQSLLEDVV